MKPPKNARIIKRRYIRIAGRRVRYVRGAHVVYNEDPWLPNSWCMTSIGWARDFR